MKRLSLRRSGRRSGASDAHPASTGGEVVGASSTALGKSEAKGKRSSFAKRFSRKSQPSPSASSAGSNASGLNVKALSKLSKAAFEGDTSKLSSALKSKKLDINAADDAGRTALHYAAWGGHVDCISRLLGEGAQSMQDADGSTPLMYAVQSSHHATMQALLRDDPSTNATLTNSLGLTCLHLSAQRGDADATDILLHSNDTTGVSVEVNAQDNTGKTPLHLAAALGDHDVMLRLIDDGGCEIDPADNAGRTPLMLAATTGNRVAVEALITNHAHPGLCDEDNWTADAYATINNHMEIAQYIQSHTDMMPTNDYDDDFGADAPHGDDTAPSSAHNNPFDDNPGTTDDTMGMHADDLMRAAPHAQHQHSRHPADTYALGYDDEDVDTGAPQAADREARGRGDYDAGDAHALHHTQGWDSCGDYGVDNNDATKPLSEGMSEVQPTSSSRDKSKDPSSELSSGMQEVQAPGPTLHGSGAGVRPNAPDHVASGGGGGGVGHAARATADVYASDETDDDVSDRSFDMGSDPATANKGINLRAAFLQHHGTGSAVFDADAAAEDAEHSDEGADRGRDDGDADIDARDAPAPGRAVEDAADPPRTDTPPSPASAWARQPLGVGADASREATVLGALDASESTDLSLGVGPSAISSATRKGTPPHVTPTRPAETVDVAGEMGDWDDDDDDDISVDLDDADVDSVHPGLVPPDSSRGGIAPFTPSADVSARVRAEGVAVASTPATPPTHPRNAAAEAKAKRMRLQEAKEAAAREERERLAQQMTQMRAEARARKQQTAAAPPSEDATVTEKLEGGAPTHGVSERAPQTTGDAPQDRLQRARTDAAHAEQQRLEQQMEQMRAAARARQPIPYPETEDPDANPASPRGTETSADAAFAQRSASEQASESIDEEESGPHDGPDGSTGSGLPDVSTDEDGDGDVHIDVEDPAPVIPMVDVEAFIADLPLRTVPIPKPPTGTLGVKFNAGPAAVGGVRVGGLLPGGAAERSGCCVDDQVVSVNGEFFVTLPAAGTTTPADGSHNLRRVHEIIAATDDLVHLIVVDASHYEAAFQRATAASVPTAHAPSRGKDGDLSDSDVSADDADSPWDSGSEGGGADPHVEDTGRSPVHGGVRHGLSDSDPSSGHKATEIEASDGDAAPLGRGWGAPVHDMAPTGGVAFADDIRPSLPAVDSERPRKQDSADSGDFRQTTYAFSSPEHRTGTFAGRTPTDVGSEPASADVTGNSDMSDDETSVAPQSCAVPQETVHTPDAAAADDSIDVGESDLSGTDDVIPDEGAPAQQATRKSPVADHAKGAMRQHHVPRDDAAHGVGSAAVDVGAVADSHHDDQDANPDEDSDGDSTEDSASGTDPVRVGVPARGVRPIAAPEDARDMSVARSTGHPSEDRPPALPPGGNTDGFDRAFAVPRPAESHATEKPWTLPVAPTVPPPSHDRTHDASPSTSLDATHNAVHNDTPRDATHNDITHDATPGTSHIAPDAGVERSASQHEEADPLTQPPTISVRDLDTSSHAHLPTTVHTHAQHRGAAPETPPPRLPHAVSSPLTPLSPLTPYTAARTQAPHHLQSSQDLSLGTSGALSTSLLAPTAHEQQSPAAGNYSTRRALPPSPRRLEDHLQTSLMTQQTHRRHHGNEHGVSSRRTTYAAGDHNADAAWGNDQSVLRRSGWADRSTVGGRGRMSAHERAEAEAEVEELQARVARVVQQHADAEEARAAAEERLHACENARDDDAAHTRQLTTIIATMKARLSVLETNGEHATAQRDQYKTKWEEESDAHRLMLAACQRANAENEHLAADVATLSNQIDVARQLEAENKHTVDTLRREVGTLTTAHRDAMSRAQDVETANRDLRSANETLARDVHAMRLEMVTLREALTADLTKAQGEVQSSTARNNELTRTLAEMEEDKFQLELQLASATSQAGSAAEGHRYETAKADKLCGEVQQLQTELGQRNRVIAELEHFRDAAHAAETASDARQVHADALAREITELQGAAAKTANELHRANDRTAALEAQLRSLTANTEHLTRTSGQKDQLLLEAQEKQAQLLQSLEERHATAMATKAGEIRSLHDQLDAVHAEKDRVLGEKDRQWHELQRQAADLDHAHAEHTALANAHAALEVERAGLIADKTHVGERLDRTKAELDSVHAMHAAAQQSNVLLENDAKQLRNEVARLKEDNASQGAEIAALVQDKGQLERILTELDHNNRDLKSEVVDRVARENTLESGIEGLHEQKQLNIRMLSELQAKVSELQGQLAASEAKRDDAEQRAAENVRLWENEVQSRSKLGLKVLDMERHAASWEERLTKEKQRTAMAMAKKREYEGKIDAVYRRNAELEAQHATATERVNSLQRELEGYKSGIVRCAAVEAELAASRAAANDEVERVRAELSRVQTQAQLAAEARANAAVAKATKMGNLVPKSEMEAYKRNVEAQARQRVSSKLGEVNALLAQTQLVHEADLQSLGQQVSDAKADLATATLGRIQAESHMGGHGNGPRERLAVKVGEARSRLAQSKARIRGGGQQALLLGDNGTGGGGAGRWAELSQHGRLARAGTLSSEHYTARGGVAGGVARAHARAHLAMSAIRGGRSHAVHPA